MNVRTTQDVLLALGTRPEIIKLGPVARELKLLDVPVRVLHTGQHYDDNMSAKFLDAMGLTIDVQLQCGDLPRGLQIGRITEQVSRLLLESRPAVMVVQGDTNTVLGAAIAANACEVPLAHVEAGLRSHDRAMPEEHNRVLVDHLADVLFAPTQHCRRNLLQENIAGEIVVSGNTELDALKMLLPPSSERLRVLRQYGLYENSYAVVTIHRPENTDDRANLSYIVESLEQLSLPCLFVLHPRTASALSRFGLSSRLEASSHVRSVQALPAQEMWSLLSCAALVLSDSGGIQEDVTVLGTPLLVIRRSTERPEALGTFSRLVPAGPLLPGAVRDAALHADQWRQDISFEPSPYVHPGGESPAKAIAKHLASMSGASTVAPPSSAALA